MVLGGSRKVWAILHCALVTLCSGTIPSCLQGPCVVLGSNLGWSHAVSYSHYTISLANETILFVLILITPC